MYIHKAVEMAIKNNCFIVNKNEEMPIGVKPTNGPDCCILFDLSNQNKNTGLRWQPQARDLMSDGWVLHEG
jgi:hypothetical protein